MLIVDLALGALLGGETIYLLVATTISASHSVEFPIQVPSLGLITEETLQRCHIGYITRTKTAETHLTNSFSFTFFLFLVEAVRSLRAHFAFSGSHSSKEATLCALAFLAIETTLQANLVARYAVVLEFLLLLRRSCAYTDFWLLTLAIYLVFSNKTNGANTRALVNEIGSSGAALALLTLTAQFDQVTLGAERATHAIIPFGAYFTLGTVFQLRIVLAIINEINGLVSTRTMCTFVRVKYVNASAGTLATVV